MAQKPLRLNQVRVLLALNKNPACPLTIDQIVVTTAADTPSKKGISPGLVRSALNGVSPKSENSKSHESCGYSGLIERGYVQRVGDGYQISLPDPHPSAGSGENDEDE